MSPSIPAYVVVRSIPHLGLSYTSQPLPLAEASRRYGIIARSQVHGARVSLRNDCPQCENTGRFCGYHGIDACECAADCGDCRYVAEARR